MAGRSATSRRKTLLSFFIRRKNLSTSRKRLWAGAMNDGKLRIPIRGVNAMTPELARVLKHELTLCVPSLAAVALRGSTRA